MGLNSDLTPVQEVQVSFISQTDIFEELLAQMTACEDQNK